MAPLLGYNDVDDWHLILEPSSGAMMRNVVFAALAGTSLAAPSPIRKVITLVEEMKANVEKEGKEDLKAYDEYKCWCDTNGAEKKEAIEYATEQIADLEAFLEEAAGKEGEFKTQISGLEQDIADDNSALATARSVRDKENEEFAAYEADSKESIGLLGQAIAVLEKVQFVQKGDPKVEAALVQVKNVVARRFPSYQNVMQKDLYDVMSSLQKELAAHGKFLQQPTGQAAGAKSYNSKSGQITGMLAEMNDEFKRDLSTAQKNEFKALEDFQNLQAAKLAEIAAATKQKEMKPPSFPSVLWQRQFLPVWLLEGFGNLQAL
jgi:hypothetical protein